MEHRLTLYVSGYPVIGSSQLLSGVQYTLNVNSEIDYNIGQVASAQIIFSTTYSSLVEDEKIKWESRKNENDTWVNRGFYYVNRITKNSNAYQVTCYDSITFLDKEVTSFLETTSATTLYQLYYRLCQYCGVTNYNTGFAINGTMPVAPKSLITPGITGRTLMQYICEAVGGFCVAEPDGSIHVDVFTAPGITISESDIESINISDVNCPRINGVRVQTEEGACYSPGANSSPQISLFFNPLFYNKKINDIQPYVNQLYSQVHQVMPYRSADIHLFEDKGIKAGNIITVNLNSTNYRVMVFNKILNDNGCELSCSGGPTREPQVMTLSDRVTQQQGGAQGSKMDAFYFDDGWISFNGQSVEMDDLYLPNIYTDAQPTNKSLVNLLNEIINVLNLRTNVTELLMFLTMEEGGSGMHSMFLPYSNTLYTCIVNGHAYNNPLPTDTVTVEQVTRDGQSGWLVTGTSQGSSNVNFSIGGANIYKYEFRVFTRYCSAGYTTAMAYPYGTSYEDIRLRAYYRPLGSSSAYTFIADETNRDYEDNLIRWELSEADSCIYLLFKVPQKEYKIEVYDSVHAPTVGIWNFLVGERITP